jgi:hypothetical protein
VNDEDDLRMVLLGLRILVDPDGEVDKAVSAAAGDAKLGKLTFWLKALLSDKVALTLAVVRISSSGKPEVAPAMLV